VKEKAGETEKEEEELKKLLKQDEGFREKAYVEPISGKIHIGHGLNIEDVPFSEDLLLIEFDRRFHKAIKGLRLLVPDFDNLSLARKKALVTMIYMLGAQGLMEFKKMLEAVNSGDWTKAAVEAEDSLWYVQAKARGKRTVRLLEGEGR